MSATDAQRWFVRIRGKVIGPFSLDQLQALRDRGRLQQDHEVSRDRRVWEPAAGVVGLFAVAPASGPEIGFSLSSDPVPERQVGDGDAEWYYARENVERGPVSWAVLKQMAASAEIGPDDRIWKGGMPEWEPASEISGLFLRGGPTGRARKSRTASTPRSEPQSKTLCDDALNQIRRQITAADLDAACQALVQIGGYALLMAMVAGPGLLIVLAIKTNSLNDAVLAAGALFGLIVLRYVAIRLSGACHSLVQSSPHRLSSPAFPDSIAIVLFFLGTAAAGYSVYAGLQEESRIQAAIWMVSGVQSLAVLSYVGCAALHPDWLNVDCSARVRAGEEGIGLAAFMLKLSLRFAPVQFGVNAALGALGLAAALVMLLAGDTLAPAAVMAGTAAGMFVLASAAIPLVAYLIMAIASVFLDLAQSVLVLPDRIDSAVIGTTNLKQSV